METFTEHKKLAKLSGERDRYLAFITWLGEHRDVEFLVWNPKLKRYTSVEWRMKTFIAEFLGVDLEELARERACMSSRG